MEHAFESYMVLYDLEVVTFCNRVSWQRIYFNVFVVV